MIRSFTIIILNLLFVPALFSQEPVMFHYSVKEGLPSKEIHWLYQDTKGYIWVCSDAGIARYNGSTFKVFDSSNGLPDNTVFEVFEDDRSRIWYRTFTGGIGYILNDSVYTLEANKKILEIQGDGLIESFALDKQNNILLGLRSFQGCFFIKINYPYTTNDVKKEASKYISSFGIDVRMTGRKAVYSEFRNPIPNYEQKKTGLFQFAISAGNNRLIAKDSFNIFETSPLSKVYFQNNRLCYLSKTNLREYDTLGKLLRISHHKSDVINMLQEERRMFMGCRNTGVTCFTGNEELPYANYLQGLSVTSVIRDHNNGYWFGTLEDGIYYCPDENYVKVKILNEKDNEQKLVCFEYRGNNSFVEVTDKGNIYEVSWEHGQKIKERLIYQNKRSDKINTIVLFGTTKILLSFNSPIPSLINSSTGKVIKADLPIYKMSRNIGPVFLAGRLKGIDVIDTAEFKILKKIDLEDRVTSFVELNGLIYAGGLRGAYVFNNNEPKPVVKKITDARVEDMVTLGGSLFIATKSHGLLIKNSELFDTIDVKRGLISNICRKMFVVNGKLWILTNKGYSVLDYSGVKKYSLQNMAFGESVLPENIDNLAVVEDRVVFHFNNDIYFFPVSQKKISEPFNLGKIFVNGMPVWHVSPLKFRYYQSNISVNLEALFYSNNRSITYRYKFKGIDKEWKYTKQSDLSFPALAPGKYHLLIEAKHSDNVWTPCSQSLLFEIDHPFWVKWWFLLMEFCLVMALAIFIFYRSYKRLLSKKIKKNIIESQFRELEIKAIKAQMDPHFIFNSLNTIQQFILVKENDKARSYLSTFARLIRKILESNTRDTINLANELEILEKYLEIESMRFEAVFKPEIVIKDNVDTTTMFIPHFMIQPVIENAIWHGLLPQKGNKKLLIILEVIDERTLSCTVDDTGVGRAVSMEKQKIEKGKSLAIDFIKQRLALMSKIYTKNYDLTVIDKMNDRGQSEGTTVIITLPILKE